MLAPTGTISFLMDCDTTGIEPDFSLVKFKELVGGGQMTIVNRTVPLALRDARLRRGRDRADRGLHQRARHDRRRARPEGRAPAGVRRRGRRARDLAHGPHRDDGRGAAVHLGRDLEDGQPARRRRPSRTSPTPTRDGWKLGLKALAIYRDGSKTAQALRTDAQDEKKAEPAEAATAKPHRAQRMPRERESITHKFSIAGHEGYITAGKYEDGSVGEIFLTDIGKEGSTLRGHDERVRDRDLDRPPVRRAARDLRAASSATCASSRRASPRNPEIPFAKSMPDYIMRWLASRFIEDVDVPRGPRHPDRRGPRAQGGRRRPLLDRRRHRRRRPNGERRQRQRRTAATAPRRRAEARRPRRSPTRPPVRPGARCRASTSARPATSAAA